MKKKTTFLLKHFITQNVYYFNLMFPNKLIFFNEILQPLQHMFM